MSKSKYIEFIKKQRALEDQGINHDAFDSVEINEISDFKDVLKSADLAGDKLRKLEKHVDTNKSFNKLRADVKSSVDKEKYNIDHHRDHLTDHNRQEIARHHINKSYEHFDKYSDTQDKDHLRKAWKHSSTAIKFAPKDPHILRHHAQVTHHVGYKEAAKDHLTKANRISKYNTVDNKTFTDKTIDQR